MLEIDDAGSGSLIGGTGIGFFKKETQEYFFKLIPLPYFQPPHFAAKKYQDYVIKLFQQLSLNKKVTIQLCPSYIFDRLRPWLSQHGYQWQNKKITGTLQNKVENSFNHYIINLGLPANFIKQARYAFNFHRLLKWVLADFKKRAPLCKTGWPSWQKWSQTPLQSAPGYATKSEYCLKCGQLITENEPVYLYQYKTNRPWTLTLHAHCAQKALPPNFDII